ncbi:MAG: YceI family protein [Solitalea-like symbiont of Acarus siro]
MKKIFFTLTIILTTSCVIFSFKNDEIKYDILKDYSNIVWFLSTSESTHSGSMQIKDGYVTVKNGNISGGKINIDVNSIINTDIKDAKLKNDLLTFLKSSNFFNVNKYPTIILEIVSSHPTTENQCLLKTNLTIKGVTIPVNFSTMIKNKTDKAILIETCRVHIVKEGVSLLVNNSKIPMELQKVITPNTNFELELAQLVGKAAN